ncbi:MAG: glycosyltransferase [Cytophagales bacterium]|nr:glycosyltransferase [Cytophagales bacterium]
MKIMLTADPEIPVPPVYYGGIERIISFLANELTLLGHTVTLLAHKDSHTLAHLIPYKGLTSNGLYDTLYNTAMLTHAYFTQKPDVIHSFGKLSYMSLLLPMQVPKIMSYQREPTLRGINIAAKLSKNGTLYFTGCSNYITQKIMPVADANTIYNGVEIDKYTYSSSVNADAPLVFLGRIEEIKGPHHAIQIAKLSNKKLILAGNLPNEAKHSVFFEAYIKPYLNTDIQYIGAVNDTQKNELLGQALAFLMPITWNEPFGIVMAEALACGTPIIGFPQGAVSEVVEHGVNGFLAHDVAEASKYINSISQISRAACRQIAENKYSSKVITSEYVMLYQKMLNK